MSYVTAQPEPIYTSDLPRDARLREMVKRLVIEQGYLEHLPTEPGCDWLSLAQGLELVVDALNRHLTD